MFAQMALPEVQEVHIVDRSLPTLNLQKNASIAYSKIIIWTHSQIGIASEEPFGFTYKAKSFGKSYKGCLYLHA